VVIIMPMPNFDLPTLEQITALALEIVTMYGDLLVVLGGVILAGLAMDWFINQIRRPPD
jgi:hypothetical protein